MATTRIQKRFRLPEYCDCREVVMRELSNRDELEASIWASSSELAQVSSSPMAALEAERRESVRISLVSVDGEPVNVDGVPFKEMDDWSTRTMNYINQFYLDLNGVETSDVKKAVAAGEVVTPPASTP